jgi:putative tricarboxylic transport membrane protein
MFEWLAMAVAEAFSPVVFIYAGLGVFIGVTVGAIPGLTGDMAIAILLPLVFKMSPASSIAMMIGIYKGSMFGGSISAVSFGVPGTPAAAATTLDGYPAKQNGEPRRAMLTALYSSVTGDLFSSLLLIFVAIPMATVALKFGPVEFFSLYVFSLMLIAVLTQGSPLKGIAAAALGLLLGAVGMDPVVGTTRLTLGISSLRGGLPLVPVLVGIFALSELGIQFTKELGKRPAASPEKAGGATVSSLAFDHYDPTKDRMSLKVYLSTFKATMVGSVAGTFVGILPGAGSSLAAFLSYGLARRFSKHPERFGKGSLEGVAGPESGNSATCGGSIIPLFAFGIPGSATAALIGAALVMQGINLGPRMLAENTLFLYSFFIILLYATFMNLGISHLLIPLYARLSMVKGKFLVPTVFILALLGTYASQNSVIDVWVLLVMGVLGYVLRKHGFPLGPLVLGFIIGPGTERSLRQALLLGHGNPMHLFSSPIAVGLYLASAAFILLVSLTFKEKKGRDTSDEKKPARTV